MGKLYNDYGKLIFEGNFFNGLKYGRGKEYDSYCQKLIFEGEYSNGKRNGRGKEYNSSNRIIYEGEYLNGRRMVV